MEFARAGEAFLRSSQPLLPFLAPSVYRSTAPRGIAQCLRQHPPSRALSTTASRHADNNVADDFSRILDETLDKTKRVPTAPVPRTSRFGSSRAQQQQRATPTARNNSSSADFLDEFGGPRTSGVGAIARMLTVDESLNPNRNTKPPEPLAPPTPPVKLNSTVGRTIPVNENRGMDVGRAFRTLEMRCAQNSVKRDFMRQRFHERGGLKRKRLKSERWRRRFKEGFRATIKLVQGLKKQGW